MILDEVCKHLGPIKGVAFRKAINRSEILRCQNISDYYFEGTDQENWNLQKDFPNCAPPWKMFWCEWNGPKKITSREGNSNFVPPYKFGALVRGMDLSEFLLEYTDKLPKGESTKSFLIGSTKAKWVLEISMFESEYFPNALKMGPYLMTTVLLVGEDGKVLDLPDIGGCNNAVFSMLPYVDGAEHIRNICDTGIRNVVLLSLCFIHCKNVHKIDNVMGPKLIKRRKKDNKIPINRYYTLDIKSFRKTADGDSENKGEGIKKSLHICRGHFKDFTKKGLFGKYKGVFWWDMQVKGSADVGTVRKDYSINEF